MPHPRSGWDTTSNMLVQAVDKVILQLITLTSQTVFVFLVTNL